jgi:Phage Tail Collar Domain
MKRRSFLQLVLALAGVPFLPKAVGKPVIPTVVGLNSNHAISSIPVGTIQTFAGNNLPVGWLPCDGREISRTQYSALFKAIGDSYGTPFKLPDLNVRMHAVPDDADRPDLCGWHGEVVYSGMQHIIKAEP